MNSWKHDGQCVEKIAFPRIVCDENGNDRKITFLNPRGYEVVKVKVDGCYITDQKQQKCNWLVIANDIEHYVELKGANLPKAFDQLSETIKQLSADRKKGRKFAFIIATRVPKQGVRVQEMSAKLLKFYNAKLIVQTAKHEHTFECAPFSNAPIFKNA